MSRSDYPPGYDDSRGPLYPPQGGNYPAPPAYGFPSYGGPQPGQPPAPYPTGPNTPLYPGQPGGYAPGPYQGQPHPAGHPGGRYPNPPPMPPVMPPTIPSDILSSGKTVVYVCMYVCMYVCLCVSRCNCVSVSHSEPVRYFVQRNQAIYWASYAVYFITHMVLVCCKGPRRKFPWNVILLLIFVSHMAVFLALGITAVVCIAVTVFCFQTKVDFTKCQGFFCVLGIVVFVTGIITTIMLWLHMLYAAIGAIAFTMFLAYHTQLLIGNRKHSISPEEYVFAALSIYVDIVQIFIFLLQIIGSSTK
uniref:Transmembrane BAX inhibitor motif containing 1a n=1 Tax=Labrus bergylta TaxID=56723 RepID=A0A3Q3MIG0_9LABR